ncbi:hypothetical protein GW17_00016656 [Ensete ventricosum]|uniref:Uncharacterized protein n=1 Tax=Ensete ventricosum TaxID=4639 RepID=A0A444F9G9_ENSVE|nr:hypothetical protein B296_00009967 [Ensete ventricosum]RWW19302.1 hypothetical protein GW17_00016656 [Ensete ventricosum]
MQSVYARLQGRDKRLERCRRRRQQLGYVFREGERKAPLSRGKRRGRSRVRNRREVGETEAEAGRATTGQFHAADERNKKERKSGGRVEIKPIDGRWRGRRSGRRLVLGELR